MRALEKFFYEIRPYLFFGGGIVAIALQPDRLMLFFGSMLLVASALIIRDRMKYRAWLASPN